MSSSSHGLRIGRSRIRRALHVTSHGSCVARIEFPGLGRPPNPPKPDNAPSLKLVEDLRSKAHNGELYGVVIRGSFTG